MMEKRNIVQRDRTPRLNQQEAMDALEKQAASLFKKSPVKVESDKKCPESSKR